MVRKKLCRAIAAFVNVTNIFWFGNDRTSEYPPSVSKNEGSIVMLNKISTENIMHSPGRKYTKSIFDDPPSPAQAITENSMIIYVLTEEGKKLYLH